MMADADGKRANPVYLGHNLDIDVTEESINHENECKITKDPYIEAVEYLEKKKILDVFQVMLEMIHLYSCSVLE